MDRGGVLDLLAIAPTPQVLRDLEPEGIATLMHAGSPRLARTLPAQILTALDAQTVVIPGTAAFGRVIAGVAVQLRTPTPSAPPSPQTSRPAWRSTLLPPQKDTSPGRRLLPRCAAPAPSWRPDHKAALSGRSWWTAA